MAEGYLSQLQFLRFDLLRTTDLRSFHSILTSLWRLLPRN